VVDEGRHVELVALDIEVHADDRGRPLAKERRLGDDVGADGRPAN
jgi:hypothetical protein